MAQPRLMQQYRYPDGELTHWFPVGKDQQPAAGPQTMKSLDVNDLPIARNHLVDKVVVHYFDGSSTTVEMR